MRGTLILVACFVSFALQTCATHAGDRKPGVMHRFRDSRPSLRERRGFGAIFAERKAAMPRAYSYGYFGAASRKHCTVHRGYYQNYLQWTKR